MDPALTVLVLFAVVALALAGAAAFRHWWLARRPLDDPRAVVVEERRRGHVEVIEPRATTVRRVEERRETVERRDDLGDDLP